jgi:tetratricopeptide (TPR) repeat protein
MAGGGYPAVRSRHLTRPVQHNDMSPAGRSQRHHRSRQQAHIVDRLTKILRTFVAGSSGPTSREGRRHRQGTFTSHAHSRERGGAPARRAWLVKRKISLWRLGIGGCVLFVLIWVGGSIIARTAAGDLARSDPNEALNWATDESIALDQLAQKELVDQNGNLDFAREWAQRALRSNPLDSRALTLLGLIAERTGDEKGADALMQIAGARTWRDRESQAWLLNRDVRRGDYAHALAHADAILRVYYREWQMEFFPVLAALTVDPRAFKALTDFLATSPPWRTWFLSQLSTRLANQGRLIQLYGALNETKKPPTKEELRPYLGRLIKDGNFDEAYQAWRSTLPAEQRVSETYPFNRDFDSPTDGLPFNWNLETVPGAEIQIVSPDGGGKPALRVQFSGARVSFTNVKQLMLLSAGAYSLRGRVKTEELVTARGLWWTIFCADGNSRTLAHTDLVSGTIPWTDFAVNFQVPATDCRAQWLQLELPARIDPEKQIAGEAWYQQLRIMPTSAAH